MKESTIKQELESNDGFERRGTLNSFQAEEQIIDNEEEKVINAGVEVGEGRKQKAKGF